MQEQGTFKATVPVRPGVFAQLLAHLLDGSDSSAAGLCIWERLSATDGSVDSIIAGDGVQGPTTVTIQASDRAFKTLGCGTWKS